MNKKEQPQNLVRSILQHIGEDSTREGLIDTPVRVCRTWEILYGGYHQNPEEILSAQFASDGYDEMVVLKDIEFYSTCEHHMLPFFGTATIGYVPKPDGNVVGISKLARLLECHARRLQIQERLTADIANDIQNILNPLGVGVLIEAQHMCMTSRGVQKQKSRMRTTCFLGCLRDKPEARAEFLS